MFERNQKMTKRLVVAGLLVGTVLFTLSGCNTKESEGVIENQAAREAQVTREAQVAREAQAAREAQVAREAQEVRKAKEVEAVKAAEEAKKAQKVEIAKLTLRINCGAAEPYTDKAGNTWLADQSAEPGGKWGAVNGLTVDRGDLGITGTDAPKIYETERYSMEGYKFTVPNGKYTVRLHFAETYDGITAEGERIFSVTINDQTVLKDFDPFKEAGGYQKPVVKTIEDVSVANGELAIGFTMNIQNPEINGIEILSK
jgi:hypothetical protein